MPTATSLDLDGVIAALNRHRQRATYGAVAALLDRTPRLLMHSRQRGPESSWVVAKGTGLPSGYADAELHPELTSNPTILATRQELAAWLADHDA
jgi:hypothetical protein